MRRCCDCVDCADCFVSDADTPCCRLSPDEKLVLKINRPAWSAPLYLNVDSDCSSCAPGQSRLTGNRNYSDAEPILATYEHFAAMDVDQGGYCWFYDDGLFGCGGTVSPANNRTDLWGLWPEVCPQKSGNLPACCNLSCACTSGATMGPIGYEGNTSAGVCATNNPNLSFFQHKIILEQPASRTFSSYSTCDDGTTLSATAACEYSGFEWLQGIYNDGRNSSYSFQGYRHYYWDGSAVVAEGGNSTPTLRPLAWTLVAVFHREKWYKSCEKSDGINSSACEQVPNWACRVPEYWVYGCAGVPVFSWEIHEMYQANKLTQAEYEDFFEAMYLRKPIPRGVAKKLEESHFEHSGSDYGILQTKDWRGATLPDGSQVPNTETRLIRKDLVSYTASGVRSVQANVFFKAREGGWTHACFYTPKGCGSANCSGQDCSYSGSEVESEAPQIPRERGCRSSCVDCDYEVWESPQGNQQARGQACFTAAPAPQCATCTTGITCGSDCTVCNGCPTECGQGVIVGCGGQDGNAFCSQDMFEANCDSVHFTWTLTTNDQTNGPDNEGCAYTNHAYLFVMNEGCDNNASAPYACSNGNCPGGPPTETEDRPSYFVATQPSKDYSCGDVPSSNYCEGARKMLKGNIDGGGTWYCPGGTIRSIPSPDPTADIPVNSAMAGPWTDRGCGRYLCNSSRNFPLGACCDPNGDCIDAVTEAQCLNCGAGSVWHGADSCCGIDDDLC